MPLEPLYFNIVSFYPVVVNDYWLHTCEIHLPVFVEVFVPVREFSWIQYAELEDVFDRGILEESAQHHLVGQFRLVLHLLYPPPQQEARRVGCAIIDEPRAEDVHQHVAISMLIHLELDVVIVLQER